MLGILFFTICFCAWLGKVLANKERNYDSYKAKGTDKYGCWRDGHNGWHYGNKVLDTFYIGGHKVLAVPDMLSYKNYVYTRYKYVVRDLTLEAQIQREVNEMKMFLKDMELRKKAIEEGKEFYAVANDYKKNSMIQNGKYKPIHPWYLYRRVDNNKLYFILVSRPSWRYTIHYLKNDYLKMKSLSKLTTDWQRSFVRTGETEVMGDDDFDRDKYGFANNMNTGNEILDD